MDQSQQDPQQQGGDESSKAQEAIQMIQAGFKQMGVLLQHAQGQVSPEDVQLFQGAVKATDDFLQAITGDQGGDQDGDEPPKQRPKQSGPMNENANAQAQAVGTPARG